MRAVAWKKLSPVAVTQRDISFWTKYWMVNPTRASQRTPGPHMRAIRGHITISPDAHRGEDDPRPQEVPGVGGFRELPQPETGALPHLDALGALVTLF